MNFRTLATVVIVTLLVSTCVLIDRAFADNDWMGKCKAVQKSSFCTTVDCGAAGGTSTCQNTGLPYSYARVTSLKFTECAKLGLFQTSDCNNYTGTNNTYSIVGCDNVYFANYSPFYGCYNQSCEVPQGDIACNLSLPQPQ